MQSHLQFIIIILTLHQHAGLSVAPDAKCCQRLFLGHEWIVAEECTTRKATFLMSDLYCWRTETPVRGYVLQLGQHPAAFHKIARGNRTAQGVTSSAGLDVGPVCQCTADVSFSAWQIASIPWSGAAHNYTHKVGVASRKAEGYLVPAINTDQKPFYLIRTALSIYQLQSPTSLFADIEQLLTK